MLARHCTHTPADVQIGAAAPQSAFAAHCTHVEVATLHLGAVAGHWAFVVHPGRHVKLPVSQTGAATPQSLFARHCTHE